MSKDSQVSPGVHSHAAHRPMLLTDYIFCEDCRTFVDLWKYDSIDDTGHGQCRWRHIKPEELEECVRGCEKEGCFDELES